MLTASSSLPVSAAPGSFVTPALTEDPLALSRDWDASAVGCTCCLFPLRSSGWMKRNEANAVE